MRLTEVEKRAKIAGIKDTWKYSKKELIKKIQQIEGSIVCFGTNNDKDCPQLACCWREDCLK